MPGPSSRPPAAPQTGWRGQPATRRASPATRILGRLVFSLLGLGLLAILAWLLVAWLFVPNVRLATLAVVNYGPLTLPPIPFSAEDLEAFHSLQPDSTQPTFRRLEHSDAMATLGTKLQALLTKPSDRLIFYVTAHGITEDGRAYLACSDYSPERGTGRYPLGDFLEHIRGCRASLKLLILDTGHLAADPRLGMVLNEFPWLLEQEVAKTADPTLWVLASNRPLEMSHTLPGARRTVFGYFVTEGLRGGADRNQDRVVDLEELAAYVQGGVARWVREDEQVQNGQTPWLLHGGQGAESAAPGLALLPVGGQPAASAKGDEPAADGADSSGKTSAEAPQGKGESAPDPAQEVRRLLEEAWGLCETVQSRKIPGGWMPVDYAPHLWREYRRMLLAYDARFRCGKAFELRELATALSKDILPLRQLLERGSLPAGIPSSSVLARLKEARSQFLESKIPASYEQLPEDWRGLAEMYRARNDLLDRLPDYVQWHAAVVAAGQSGDRLRQAIEEIAVQRLPNLVALLEAVERPEPGRELRPEDVPARLARIREQRAALELLQAAIERDGLEADARGLLKAPAKSRPTARIEACLATPLLAGTLRMKLVDALLSGESAGPSLEWVADAGGPLEISSVRWRSVLGQARLEAAAGLCGAERAGAAGQKPAPFSLPSPGLEGDEARNACRILGHQLAQFYENLPGQVERGLAPGQQPAIVTASARLLRSVDARDASRIDKIAVALAVRPAPRPALAAEIRLVGLPEALDLRQDAWTDLELALEAPGRASDEALVQLQYDPATIEILDAGTRPEESATPTPVPAGKEREARLDAEHKARLRYRLRAKATRDGTTGEVRLAIKASRGDAPPANGSVAIRLPQPDVVDLRILPEKKATLETGATADAFRLLPFPNRLTHYRLELVNRSGRRREVTVRWFGAVQPAGERRGPRPSPLDSLLGKPKVGFEERPPMTIALPEQAVGVPLPFPELKLPEPKPEAKPAKEPAAKPGEPPREALPPLPVTHGLVLLIQDAASKREWLKWIEFSPRTPKDYVEPAVSYSQTRRRIEIQVKPRGDGQGRPDLELLPPDGKIDVVWETAGLLEPGTEMNDRARLGPPDYRATLFAEVAPQVGRMVWVRLTVDGYPRALVYQVRCDHDRDNIPREGTLFAVRITQPPPGKAFLAPLEQLPVEFQVDAPDDAFQNDRDMVQVAIYPERNRQAPLSAVRQFFSNRQVEVTVQETSAQGGIKIKADVHDFRSELAPGGLRNTRAEVVARLLLPDRPRSQGPSSVDHAIPVVLDGDPPKLQVVVPATPTPQGKPVEISARTEDLSGVVKLEAGFDTNRSGELEESENPKVLQQADGRRTEWKTQLSTEKLEPGGYQVVVRATDAAQRTSKDAKLVTIAALGSDVPGGEMKVKPALSTIQGTVKVGDQPCADFKVQLRSGEALVREVTTDENGGFTIPNLPAGNYKLQTAGSHRNRVRSGEQSVTLPAEQDPAVVRISAE